MEFQLWVLMENVHFLTHPLLMKKTEFHWFFSETFPFLWFKSNCVQVWLSECHKKWNQEAEEQAASDQGARILCSQHSSSHWSLWHHPLQILSLLCSALTSVGASSLLGQESHQDQNKEEGQLQPGGPGHQDIRRLTILVLMLVVRWWGL